MVREVFTERSDFRQIAKSRNHALAVAAVLTVVCAVTLSRGFADQIARDIFFSLTLAGCAIVFLSVRPWREFAQALTAGLFLVALQVLVLKTPLKVLPALALIGLGSLALLAIRIWFSDKDRQLLRDATLPPLLFILLGFVGSGPLQLTARLQPKTWDLFLYSFDQSLGVQLSFKVGQIVLSSRLLTRAVLGMYYVLPFFIMYTYARQLVRNRSLAMAAFLAFVIAGPLGVVFYNIVPGGGPGNLFGSNYPFHPLTVEQLRQLPIQPLTIGGPRNAFPSLHLGWALLACWYAQGLSRWSKLAFFFFFVGTVISTLGLGEHYFIDLITAFPFALMIHAACVPNSSISDARRVVPLLAGTAMMVSWIVLLRWGLALVWINPLVPWLLSAATIAVTVVLQLPLRPLLAGSPGSARPVGEA